MLNASLRMKYESYQKLYRSFLEIFESQSSRVKICHKIKNFSSKNLEIYSLRRKIKKISEKVSLDSHLKNGKNAPQTHAKNEFASLTESWGSSF